MPDFDLNALIAQVQNPAEGLPILGIMVLLNAFLGMLVAKKEGTFTRDYMLNFVETRVLYQALPIAVVGFAAIYKEMPLLSWVYVTMALVMVVDLFMDLKDKIGALFPNR